MFYMQDLIPLFVFGGIVMGIWAFLSMISNRNSKAMDRLSRLSRPQSLADIEDPNQAMKKEKFAGLLEAARSLARPLMPQTELENNAIKQRLANAGFRSDTAVAVYSGIRLACLGGFFALGLALCLPGNGLNWPAIRGIAILTGIGFYLPSVVLWHLRRKRQEDIFLTLPDALDL